MSETEANMSVLKPFPMVNSEGNRLKFRIGLCLFTCYTEKVLLFFVHRLEKISIKVATHIGLTIYLQFRKKVFFLFDLLFSVWMNSEYVDVERHA